MQREDAGKVFLLIFLLIVAVFTTAFINADIAVAEQVFLLSKVDLEQ